MKKLKASVVIPVYNGERYVRELITGLNKQTEKNFEVIVVDDGSTDNSLKIIKETKKAFKLRVIKQENSGPAAARNKGAKNSKADIIIFIDSDCDPRPDFIEKIIEPLKDKEVVGVQAETETKNKHSLIARYVSYEIYYRHESMKNNKKILDRFFKYLM